MTITQFKNNRGVVQSGGGGGGQPVLAFNYFRRLRVNVVSASEVSIQVSEIVMRGFTRGTPTSPVEFADDSKLFGAISETVKTNRIGVSPGGFTTLPANGTLWRLFVVGKENGDVGAIAAPFSASTFVETDLPASQYIPSEYIYIREVGECYVKSFGGALFTTRRTDNYVEISEGPLPVFSNSSISTEVAGIIPSQVPFGIEGLELYATSVANITSDAAIALKSTSGSYRQFQTQNIGFDAYTESPTGTQGDRPQLVPWDGSLFAFVKSMKPDNASTGSQSISVNGYVRKV